MPQKRHFLLFNHPLYILPDHENTYHAISIYRFLGMKCEKKTLGGTGNEKTSPTQNPIKKLGKQSAPLPPPKKNEGRGWWDLRRSDCSHSSTRAAALRHCRKGARGRVQGSPDKPAAFRRSCQPSSYLPLILMLSPITLSLQYNHIFGKCHLHLARNISRSSTVYT